MAKGVFDKTIPEPCPKCGEEASATIEEIEIHSTGKHVFKSLACFFCNYSFKDHQIVKEDDDV